MLETLSEAKDKWQRLYDRFFMYLRCRPIVHNDTEM